MPHIFGPKWIRVKTPATTNGVIPAQDDNGKQIYTEIDLPLTSRAAYENENKKLQAPYRHIIIEMHEDIAPNPETLVKGAGKTSKKPENADSLV